MTTSRSTVAESLKRLEREVSAWPEIEVRRHRTGCTQFRSPAGEVGHLHQGGLLDVPFSREVRDRLVSCGQARPHHVMPASGWVSYRVRSEAELPGALALLRLSYEGQRQARTGHEINNEAPAPDLLRDTPSA